MHPTSDTKETWTSNSEGPRWQEPAGSSLLPSRRPASPRDGQPPEVKPLPTLWEVLNEIGPGLFQIRAQLVGGGMFLADGAEIQTVATVTLPLARELGLTPTARGSLTSAVYVGVMAGSLASGAVGDTFGRRPPIIFGFGMLAVLALASALAQSYGQLLALRALFGVAYGVGGPCWNTMAAEIVPASWRMVMAGTSQVYFQIGELYSILITWLNDPLMRKIDWRWQLVMSAVPAAVCFLLAIVFLDETPAFLAIQGEYAGAKKVLDRMRSMNGRGSVSLDFRSAVVVPVADESPRSSRWQLAVVFGRHYILSTLTLSYSFMVINFIFYGNLYVFPQVLPEVSQTNGMTPTASMALGVLTGEIPGVLVGATLGSLLPRRWACALYMSALAAASLTFGATVDLAHHTPLQQWTLFGSYMVLRFFGNFAFVILWQYSAEVFPTVARATGCATAFGAGRLGAIVAPPAYEHLRAAAGGMHRPYFALCGIICLVNLFPLWFSAETQGKNLSDTTDDPEHECQPLVH